MPITLGPARTMAAALLMMFATPGWVLAQRGVGELRLRVVDATGAPVQASGILRSEATHVMRTFSMDPSGAHVAKDLPFAVYSLTMERAGFAPYAAMIDVRTEVPIVYQVMLVIAPLQTSLTVTSSETHTLLDPYRPGSAYFLGADLLRDRRSATPGRSIIDLVDTQPGWLLEANGVLHPRGSEYQVQYVVDGIPFRDNRSPAFAQSFAVDQFESMTVRTSGFPAEYGGKLGGVIDVNTIREARQGFHGTGSASAGSFKALEGSFLGQFVTGRTSLAANVNGMRTDRYLDPPVEQNHTNHGHGGGATASVERDWNDSDRTRLSVQHYRTNFLVPNEALQELAGQRQTRTADETLAYAIHEHVFSPRVFGGLRFMVRDTGTTLDSNAASTPIRPTQQRGLREAYVSGTASMHQGRHELKFGGDATFATVNEQFASAIVAYSLSGVQIFDRELPAAFAFSDSRANRELSAFVQDQFRYGPVTLSAGLRYDRYHLTADEQAISPRLSGAWFVAPAGLVIRASYDRTFQTPARENILLASSDLVEQLGGEGRSLALKSSHGNFYEIGGSKTFSDKVRIDGNYFYRSASNFADDDVLLNTAISFPIAFSHGTVKGVEAKVEVPHWGPWSGALSYSHSIGAGQLPISGGLFLGDEVDELVNSTDTFALSQDQRHTLRARIRGQLGPRAWGGAALRYDSGLPVEIEGAVDENLLIQQFGRAVVGRVDFDAGRVEPSLSLDASLSVQLTGRDRGAFGLRADVFNLANRLNVINFAGLLSGTALAPGRTFALRVNTRF